MTMLYDQDEDRDTPVPTPRAVTFRIPAQVYVTVEAGEARHVQVLPVFDKVSAEHFVHMANDEDASAADIDAAADALNERVLRLAIELPPSKVWEF